MKLRSGFVIPEVNVFKSLNLKRSVISPDGKYVAGFVIDGYTSTLKIYWYDTHADKVRFVSNVDYDSFEFCTTGIHWAYDSNSLIVTGYDTSGDPVLRPVGYKCLASCAWKGYPIMNELSAEESARYKVSYFTYN